MEEFNFKSSFELINRLVQNNEIMVHSADLSKIEKIIKEDIQESLKEDAPHNFPELLFGLKYEFDKLRDFVLFDKLIGKNVVALGGAFSTGKSTFLNSLIGKKILPAKIEPSTSVPTYIIGGEERVFAINSFMKSVELELGDLKTISHGFSDEYPVSFGHLLRNIFLETPSIVYENTAFLDTPGYSKPDDEYYSERTDENIARAQLNSSDYILWFVNIESGVITQEDIKFLQSLKKEIPKLIVVNKCDKKDEANVKLVLEKVKETLVSSGIMVEGVVPYSCRHPDKYGKEEIKEYLKIWEGKTIEFTFARNFKTLFVECKGYFEDILRTESKRLNRLNQALTFAESMEVLECLNSLAGEIKANIRKHKDKEEQLQAIQDDFFEELKVVGDKVGIKVPEISELDLIERVKSPLEVIREFKSKNNIKDTDYNQIIRIKMMDLDNKYVKTPGNIDYKEEIVRTIKEKVRNIENNMKFRQGGEEYSKAIFENMVESMDRFIEENKN